MLRWNRIAYGAEAFLNGRKVWENEPTGPFQVILEPSVLKSGEYQLLLKVRGGAGVRKSRSGNALKSPWGREVSSLGCVLITR